MITLAMLWIVAVIGIVSGVRFVIAHELAKREAARLVATMPEWPPRTTVAVWEGAGAPFP